MKIRYVDHVTKEKVLRRSSTISLHVIIAHRRLRLAGHILRMPQKRISLVLCHGLLQMRNGHGGQSKNTWRRTLANGLKSMNISRKEDEVFAKHAAIEVENSASDVSNSTGATKSNKSNATELAADEGANAVVTMRSVRLDQS
ncbi:hypothetical protein Y032_0025g1255 [Ancylostoma ceylanicum]|uniref:Uncharacterized protein n=1 Tax=Ancylostoma ceylanicum TaxID=53326 RepID=A0A016UVL1_9BILA|nr:hypothetical protein Y032_0025g1255 [Ancylostoma ceylanicum]